jgi:hypothetical protein
VTRCRRRALRLASGLTGSHADAEDVVQDVFRTVVRKTAAYQNRCRRHATWDEASRDDVVPAPVRDWSAAEALGLTARS